MDTKCVCGHRELPHLDEGGEYTYCWDCCIEAPKYEIACRTWIPRVEGWDYVR